MNLLLQGVQFTHPIGRQLLVQQLLGTLPIVDPKKLILTAFILQTDPVHLPSQPLPAVDADLNLEGNHICSRTYIQPKRG